MENNIENKEQFQKLKVILNKFKEEKYSNLESVKTEELEKLKNLTKMIHSILPTIKPITKENQIQKNDF